MKLYIFRKGVNIMIKVNFSSKRGKRLFQSGANCCHTDIYEIYYKPSKAKVEAFEGCWKQFIESDNHSDFGVGNATPQHFTASWLCTIDNEPVMRIETAYNSYALYINR